MLPTNNIYQRTFYLKIGENTRTCFTIDERKRQTLKHHQPPIFIHGGMIGFLDVNALTSPLRTHAHPTLKSSHPNSRL